MEYGRIPGVDKAASRVAQGLMMLTENDLAGGFELLDAVYEGGITLFDSAHIYGGGQCDRVFGRWVAERGLREKVVLMDKCSHHHGEVNRVTPECITSDLNDCLERLNFETIDIFSFHRDDETQPVGPLVERLNEHVSEGKVRAFGASNWTHHRIAEANAYAAANGLAGFAVASPQYSLAECLEDPWGRGSVWIGGPRRRDARDWYQANQMPILSWSSLAGGFFSGRFSRDNVESFTDDADTRCVRCYCSEDNFRRLDRAGELAAEKGVDVAQIALAFLIRGPLNVFPLMAAWTLRQAADNAGACDFELTEADVAYLDLERDTR